MRRYDRSYSLGLLLAGALLLAACGSNRQTGSSADVSTPSASEPATQTTASATRPTEVAANTAAATTMPTSATKAAASSPATATVTGRTSQYGALPQGKTQEGYYVLGDPNAPVVISHYSDFL